MYQNIYPKPQKIIYADGHFAFEPKLTVKINPEFTKKESFKLFSEIWKNFTAGVCILRFEESTEVRKFEWEIGNPQDIALADGLSYCVHTDKDGIIIKAD